MSKCCVLRARVSGGLSAGCLARCSVRALVLLDTTGCLSTSGEMVYTSYGTGHGRPGEGVRRGCCKSLQRAKIVFVEASLFSFTL